MTRSKIYKLIPEEIYEIPYALQSDSSQKLRRYVHAALLAYKEDIDFYEILEELLSENEENFNMYLNIETTRDSIIEVIKIAIEIVTEVTKDSKKPDHIVYSLSMGRLQSTFESCLVLLRRGYFIESTPLFRLIFEQISWSYSIIGLDIEEIKKTSTTKNVKKLNELIEGSSRHYNTYTREAHLDVSKIGYYVREESGGVASQLRSGIKSKERYDDVFFLASLYLKSIEKFIDSCDMLDAIIDVPTFKNEEKFKNMTLRENLDNINKVLSYATQMHINFTYNKNLEDIKLTPIELI